MLRILWAVSCRSYDLQDDGTVNIEGAGVNTIWAETLPLDIELEAVSRLAMDEGEEAEIETHLIGPNMTPLGAADVPIRAGPPPDHVPGFEVHMTQPIEFQFEATEEGTYSLELYMPDARRESLFWVVKRGEPPTY